MTQTKVLLSRLSAMEIGLRKNGSLEENNSNGIASAYGSKGPKPLFPLLLPCLYLFIWTLRTVYIVELRSSRFQVLNTRRIQCKWKCGYTVNKCQGGALPTMFSLLRSFWRTKRQVRVGWNAGHWTDCWDRPNEDGEQKTESSCQHSDTFTVWPTQNLKSAKQNKSDATLLHQQHR